MTTATLGVCAVCERQVPVYARPRAGEDQPRPRAHKHPTNRTGGGWPAMCPGAHQQVKTS